MSQGRGRQPFPKASQPASDPSPSKANQSWPPRGGSRCRVSVSCPGGQHCSHQGTPVVPAARAPGRGQPVGVTKAVARPPSGAVGPRQPQAVALQVSHQGVPAGWPLARPQEQGVPSRLPWLLVSQTRSRAGCSPPAVGQHSELRSGTRPSVLAELCGSPGVQPACPPAPHMALVTGH